jgi:hypothetical protein
VATPNDLPPLNLESQGQTAFAGKSSVPIQREEPNSYRQSYRDYDDVCEHLLQFPTMFAAWECLRRVGHERNVGPQFCLSSTPLGSNGRQTRQ